MKIAVLGLGEAGSRLAADLEAAGADVAGYDPDPVRGAAGTADVVSAVAGSEIVLSVNAAAVAAGVAAAASQALGQDAIYPTSTRPLRPSSTSSRSPCAGKRLRRMPPHFLDNKSNLTGRTPCKRETRPWP